MRVKLNMMTNFEFSTGEGSIQVFNLVHSEIDYGDDRISIALDNGSIFVISKNSISKEEHTDSSDLFECVDGTRYYLEYPEFV